MATGSSVQGGAADSGDSWKLEMKRGRRPIDSAAARASFQRSMLIQK